jgi:hypothetical protein
MTTSTRAKTSLVRTIFWVFVEEKQGSSQGILLCQLGKRAPPAGMHETKKKKS